ncbi:hypothetical protein SLE2022_385140 [Rubroshorea leprosula]
MEEGGDTPFFWLQTTDNRRNRRRRSSRGGGQSSSFFFNTGFLVILLVFVALAFIFFVIPSFLSFTSQIFSPHSVKKGWNSLNFVLVLFAIVCGFLSGNGSGDDNGGSEGRSSFAPGQRSNSNSSTPRQWYEFSDRNSLRRMRSFNSYPDLRLESSWMVDDDRRRFHDDTGVYDYRGSSSNQLYHRRSWGEREEEGGFGSTPKDIVVDSIVTEAQRRVSHAAPPHQFPPRPQSPPAQPVPPPSPPRPVSQPPQPESPPPAPRSPPRPAPNAVRRKPKRTYQDLASTNPQQQTPSTPPPPPPPPPPLFEKSSKSEKKRGSATKDFLNSLRRKKKKQRQRSVENLDALFNPEPSSSTLPLYPPPSPPPPPPPPPPPAFFHNIFSGKKSKAKKTPSPAHAPSLPQPKPLEARASKVVPQKAPVTTSKPPLPVKISSITNVEESTDSGNESPSISIPPPPPLPPFKIPEWKFVEQGDFVRLKSFQSSRSGSPDSDGVEDPLSGESSPSNGKKGESVGGDSSAAMFCPSPDVNTKADNFIARFRAGLQLEKMDSVKRRGRSNLGPDPVPSSSRDSL